MTGMTDSEKTTMVKAILGISDSTQDSLITTYLNAAKREILSWRYSYSDVDEDDITAVPVEYDITQVYAIVAGYSQSGAENQTQHSENGITRAFKHSDMVEYIRSNVIPICKVM